MVQGFQVKVHLTEDMGVIIRRIISSSYGHAQDVFPQPAHV